ncbi:MAG TPA: N-acetylgalactosamine-6-sulfatase [Rhodopirellula baltica]|uniref:N-acetylgalactosamine-6-sulfatase n=1 Tax=Rhodopirellula baltica (strain DSM 10527 / NCIMB 13988 / SH1) TaxID=243090 RepID=Q7UH85_RHOBA|nr:sulfatase-like hydrolase/transferase [Rhodopirellula baltica]CAD78091.1 N-acetylgalactosamine-6-sulfatase [Rhodopirellula baltica SH 1]HBE64817.1 N-acetylgalactosamine-6-sulfatase [Rhodopirellula baltica]
MKRSTSFFIFALCLLVACNTIASDSPNIILCMADDQGWGDTGYNGHPHLRTPHLDQMAAEGVTFTRFYAAAAMCSPTRASCYTGRNPYRFGVTFAMKGMLEPTEIPITTVLKQHGYTTGHFGKWHLGTLSKTVGDQNRWGTFAKQPERYYCPPWERDVDVCFVTESKVPTWNPLVHPGPISKKQNQQAPKQGQPYGNEYFTGPGQKETDNMDGDDSRVIMDRAIPFIRDAVQNDRPFFAAVWFHTPHSPVIGGPKYREMYREQPEPAQHYYACLTAMDEQVGRLRAELKSLGVADNTMLCFCSDNGPARQGSPRHVGSAKNLKGYKLSIDEGGIRVPGLMVWPNKVDSPRTLDAPCFTTDYFPTILDAIGVDLPTDRTYDGTSLIPLVTRQTNERQKPLGFLNRDGKESVWMQHRYKLVSTESGDRLYDIPRDPAEATDVAQQLPEVTTKMKKELTRWKATVMSDLQRVP